MFLKSILKICVVFISSMILVSSVYGKNQEGCMKPNDDLKIVTLIYMRTLFGEIVDLDEKQLKLNHEIYHNHVKKLAFISKSNKVQYNLSEEKECVLSSLDLFDSYYSTIINHYEKNKNDEAILDLYLKAQSLHAKYHQEIGNLENNESIRANSVNMLQCILSSQSVLRLTYKNLFEKYANIDKEMVDEAYKFRKNRGKIEQQLMTLINPQSFNN